MAKKPNYNFEKRQKELARKAKQEEKARRKQEGRNDDEDSDDSVTPSEDGETLG